MGWERIPDPAGFERARRQRVYRAAARTLKGEEGDGLLPLDDVREKLRIFEQVSLGVQPIRIDRIVGTVGREGDFDREFLPLRQEQRDRWRSVDRAVARGTFPPIQVYQLGDIYFVQDGHHRVAVAKHRGAEFIDADVTLLRSRFDLPPDADLEKLLLAEQERIFLEESGLDRARPEARVLLTHPQGYRELLESVELHGYHVMRDRGEVVPKEEVAADWYDHVYLPGVAEIRQEGLFEAFPHATEGDLFLWVHQQRRALYPERGGLSVAEAAREVRRRSLPAAPRRRRPWRPAEAAGRLRARRSIRRPRQED